MTQRDSEALYARRQIIYIAYASNSAKQRVVEAMIANGYLFEVLPVSSSAVAQAAQKKLTIGFVVHVIGNPFIKFPDLKNKYKKFNHK